MPNFRIRAAGKGAAEVYLYDAIGGWDGITAKQFADQVNSFGAIDTLNVRINSPGGDVFDGLAIYNTMRRMKATVNIDIDGMALSIASIIAMAGDTVRMADNAMFMIHDPWSLAMGGADELRKQADLMDQVKDSLVGTYQKRTKMADDVIAQMMSEETWMDASTAKKWGFIDEVTGEVPMAASFDLSRFKHPPKIAASTAVNSPYRAKIAAMSNRISR